MLFFSFSGKVIPNEKVHPRLWKGSDRKFRYINWKNAEKKKQNKVIIDSQHFAIPLWFLHKSPLRNEHKNVILMTCLYPDLPGQCFWLVVLHGKFASTNQKHYPDLGSNASSVLYRNCVFVLVSQASFPGETNGGVAKCWLFCQARLLIDFKSRSGDLLDLFSVVLSSNPRPCL